MTRILLLACELVAMVALLAVLRVDPRIPVWRFLVGGGLLSAIIQLHRARWS